MAGEGLFFTGQVLKNNRNLLQEEATRQQLKLQKEQLDMQKGEFERKATKLRKDGEKPNFKDYTIESMDRFFADVFQDKVESYQNFSTDNALILNGQYEESERDSFNQLTKEKQGMERDLTEQTNLYKSLSSGLSSLRELSKDASKASNLKRDEDGSYLYESNYSKIKNAVLNEGMTISEAIDAYPIDAESMVNQTAWVDPTEAMFEDDNVNREGKYDDDEAGYTFKIISNDQKNLTEQRISNKLKVNSDNIHTDANYLRIYNTKELDVNGNKMSAQDAFFLEAYEDPESGEIGGITDSNIKYKLDPSNENFDKTLSDKYAEYLAKKISEEGYKNMGPIRDSKITGETKTDRLARESKEAQSKYDLDTYNYINKSKPIDKHGTGVTQYESDNDNVVNQSLDSNQASVKVSVSDFHKSMSPEALLAFKKRVMQDSLKEIDTEEGKAYIADDSNFTGIEINLIEVGIDGSGNVIGILQLGEGQDAPKAIIPWNQLSSAEHDTALKVEGVQRVIDYRQPKTQTTPSTNERADVL